MAGIIVGLTVTLAYIFAAKYGGFTILGIIDTGAGIFGAIAAFATNIIVSLATPAPSKELQDAVINLRYPEQMVYKDGEVYMDDETSDKSSN